MKRLLKAILTHAINGLAGFLPDDRYSDRVRPILYKALRMRYGARTSMKGGGRINGFGLTLGSRVFINRECYFDLSAPVTIGDSVVVGHHVTFITADHEIGPASRRSGEVKRGPIVIGDGAWIGARAVILPGVTVGKGSVVGAGSLVTRDVAENSVVVGVPAKVLRDLSADLDPRS